MVVRGKQDGGGNWRLPLGVVKDRRASGRTAGSIKKRGCLQLSYLTTRGVLEGGEDGADHAMYTTRLAGDLSPKPLTRLSCRRSARINYTKPIGRLHPITCGCKTLSLRLETWQFPPPSSSMTVKTVHAER